MVLESILNILDAFGRAFIFDRWREPLRQYFLRAGFEKTPYSLFGILFLVVMVLTYGFFLAFLPLIDESLPITKGIVALLFWIAVPTILISFVALVTVFTLNLKVYARVREMESNLPEYLQLVITNLKSGMNFEQSLWSAARPEFGILSNEVTLVSKQVLTGIDTADALHEFTIRYDSPTLTRSFNLIISELRSGGEIVQVIDRVVVSLKRTKDLKEEMSANVLSFIIFISVIVCFLTPVLFALANTLLAVMLNFAKLLGGSFGSAGSALGSGAQFATTLKNLATTGPTLQSNFLKFSYWAIGIIAFSASLIVSIIEKGDIRGGIKYIPIFTATALVLFGIFVAAFRAAFSSLLG